MKRRIPVFISVAASIFFAAMLLFTDPSVAIGWLFVVGLIAALILTVRYVR
jgi:hypothetical protein